MDIKIIVGNTTSKPKFLWNFVRGREGSMCFQKFYTNFVKKNDCIILPIRNNISQTIEGMF